MFSIFSFFTLKLCETDKHKHKKAQNICEVIGCWLFHKTVCQHLTSKTVQSLFFSFSFLIFLAIWSIKDIQAHSYSFSSILDIVSFALQLSLFIESAYKNAPDLLVIPDRSTQSWSHSFFSLCGTTAVPSVLPALLRKKKTTGLLRRPLRSRSFQN